MGRGPFRTPVVNTPIACLCTHAHVPVLAMRWPPVLCLHKRGLLVKEPMPVPSLQGHLGRSQDLFNSAWFLAGSQTFPAAGDGSTVGFRSPPLLAQIKEKN